MSALPSNPITAVRWLPLFSWNCAELGDNFASAMTKLERHQGLQRVLTRNRARRSGTLPQVGPVLPRAERTRMRDGQDLWSIEAATSAAVGAFCTPGSIAAMMASTSPVTTTVALMSAVTVPEPATRNVCRMKAHSPLLRCKHPASSWTPFRFAPKRCRTSG